MAFFVVNTQNAPLCVAVEQTKSVGISMKYPINKEFFPFSVVTPPISSAKMAGWLGSMMKAPAWIKRDRQVAITKQFVKSYDGKDIKVYLFEPYGLEEPAPCLVYYHGGGFFFGAANYHYKIAKQYALETSCKIVFVDYRLAPKHPHPTPAEDCYSALCWTFENADKFAIDKSKIAVGGDSAGGALAAAVCQMARDRKTDLPLFQLLVYPVTDRKMQTESCKQFINTPMWNTKLSQKMWIGYIQEENASNIAYASPMDATYFGDLPTAYVETAEFDCLRDEGINYANAMLSAGVKVQLNQTKGTMHGFDIVMKAPTTKQAVQARIAFMKSLFYQTDEQ